MTPEEVLELSYIGFVFCENFVRTIIAFVLFGIYCLAWCIIFFIYWRNSTASDAKETMICVLFGTFVLMLLFLGSQVAPVPGLIKYDIIMTLPGGIMEQIVVAKAESHITIYDPIHDWLFNIIVITTDTVIMWRAWAMWKDNTKAKWTLLLLMLANIDIILGVGLADSNTNSSPSRITQDLNNIITLDWPGCIINPQSQLPLLENGLKGREFFFFLQSLGQFMRYCSCCGLLVFAELQALNPVVIFILVHTQNTYEQSFHLAEISELSQQALESQQVSVILSGTEGISTDVGFAAC
ncbi:hypothetical protein BDP27DRAFT_1520147 [Rhodocollybia butyracea]|uniref:Uncharacterized protein n=1 Tax=Rhodocollybia butyracea TaxID=206335 RepID=A0A9P5U7V4_9AGAR|nr:hypothetical protein BDP27DRAFT_1520147 [Rhodocollybia butyracea]